MRIYIFLLCCFLGLTVQAQQWGAELHLHKAMVIRGAQSLGRGNPQTLGLRLLKSTQGQEWWHQPHQFPRFGVNINYLDFNDPVLGQVISAQFTGERKIIHKKRWRFNFLAGMGLAWATNPFDRQKNNKNIMLGSHLNSSWIANFSFAFRLKVPWYLLLETGIIHYSNGAMQLPNQGVNLATVNLGVSYKPQAPTTANVAFTSPLPKSQWLVSSSIGFVEKYPTNGFKYRVYGLQAFRQQMWGRVTFWQIGLEGFYNTWLYELTRPQEQPNAGRLAVNAGLGWVAGKVQGDIALGVYAYKPQIIDSWVYERYGLRYFITPHLFVSFHVKSQRGSVDNLEFSSGWRF